MNTSATTGGVILLILSLIAWVISCFQFIEKGFLFNNAYIWATARERRAMNKKPYYRQSAMAFGLVGMMFLLMAAAAFSGAGWLWLAGFAVAIAAVIYALASSARIGQNRPKA